MKMHVPRLVWTSSNSRLRELQTQAAEEQSVSAVYCDKNLEQRVNIQFCVTIGKSNSETLAIQLYMVIYTWWIRFDEIERF
jgi:hypothetical protein